jgi:general secretion pathway protein N
MSRDTPPWTWVWLGALAGLLLSVTLVAPAQWLAYGVARVTDQRVQLQAAQGTVWNGHAQLTLGGEDPLAPRTALPGKLEWQLQPHWQGLRVRLSAPCCLDSAWTWELQPRWLGLQVRPGDRDAEHALRLPSALLTGLGTPWNTLQLEGTLALSTRALLLDLDQDHPRLQGQLQLQALAMSTALSPLRPVGSYVLTLEGGLTPTLALRTLEGGLQLQGKGLWRNGQLQFTGDAQAAPGQEEALANLLNIIGRRSGARSILQVG